LCVREFDAEVVILHHATTINVNYQAMMHCGGIRQSVKAISIISTKEPDTNFLRTGDKGLIKFRFLYSPEFLKEGSTIMFREGRTKGLGYVTKVYPGK
jgi:GTPase